MAVGLKIESQINSGAVSPAARAMARIHELELVVAEGGVSSAAVWQELGELKTTVGDLHGGVFCLEAALFHGADVKRILPLVTKSRSTLLTASTEIEGLLDLALRATLSPSEAGLLGARIMELVVHGEAVFEALLQQVEKVFSADDLPLSRRFVWSVLATLKRRTRDVLGITRAKERILGQLNTAGLHPVNDLPGFVRLALAIDGGDNTQGSTSEQLPALESLFRRVAPTLRELDVLSGYIRLIFAIGFVRLGVNSIARDLVAPVEAEIVVHEIPNAVLFRLYLARLAHTATGSRDEGAWMRDAEGILDMA